MKFQSTRPRGARPRRRPPSCWVSPVSIHAPARGATLAMPAASPIDLVSIHAPARGATFAANRIRVDTEKFQSTRPRGARLLEASPTRSYQLFQSTRPRGARQQAYYVLKAHKGFNPRARAGRDRLVSLCISCSDVSIHAPARGATVGTP